MLGLLTGILGGKGSGLLETGLKVVDELYDSPEEKRQAEITLEKIEARLKEKQIQINIEQAKSKSLFVAGARPFIQWVCATGLAYAFLVAPTVEFFLPDMDKINIPVEIMMELTLATLGMATLRTVEKIKKVQRNN
jgi:hypothetical protein